MTQRTKARRIEQGMRKVACVFALACTAGLALACVGGERNVRSEAENARKPETARPPPTTLVLPDTVSPVDYQVFEKSLESEQPRKALIRLLVLSPAGRPALGKTLRVALDSLGRADSTLVAARAILYTGRTSGPSEMTLKPVAWGEWIPPEGWDRATAESRSRLHRTFVYHGDPGWSSLDSASRREAVE